VGVAWLVGLPNDSPHRTLDWADGVGHFRVSLAPVSSMTLCTKPNRPTIEIFTAPSKVELNKSKIIKVIDA
jgi:hypothetical protein